MSYIDNIRQVTPYTPGEQPKVTDDLIKLNTNEFPYAPSPKVYEAIEKLDINEMRLYPNVTAAPLAKAIAKRYGFSEDEVFVGVGSDDVLANCFLTFFSSDKPVLFPDITYSFYDVWASIYRIPYEEMPLDEDFKIVKEDYYRRNGGIVIANPNAPTSIAMPLEIIEDIVSHNPDSVVVIDEAYIDFGGESALPLVKKYDNVVVVQTFSKSRAFAGMRIGYAIANSKLISYMNNVKFAINSYTMNLASISYGVASIEDEEYFKASVSKVVATRERSAKELKALGFDVLDSATNFLFVTHETKKAKDIFEYLKTKNIYVRYFNKPRINNYLRITIGTDEQMDRLIEAIKEYL